MNLEEGIEDNATRFNDELAKHGIFMYEVNPWRSTRVKRMEWPSAGRINGRSRRRSSLRRVGTIKDGDHQHQGEAAGRCEEIEAAWLRKRFI